MAVDGLSSCPSNDRLGRNIHLLRTALDWTEKHFWAPATAHKLTDCRSHRITDAPQKHPLVGYSLLFLAPKNMLDSLAGLTTKPSPTKAVRNIHIVRHPLELCIIIHLVPSDSEALKAFMEDRHLGQVELARAAGVSQSTVSRALSGLPLKHGRARSKLFAYAQLTDPYQQVPPRKGPQRVMTAFHRIWDGTDDHANAVAKIIDALEDLKPARKKRG